MSTVEYRVRPVERFVVTKYTSGPNTGVCVTLGEFPNLDTATTVKNAFELTEGLAKPYMQEHLPPSDDETKYVVVCRGFDVQTMALYASGKEQADRTREVSEAKYGGEWRIFELVR